MLRTFPRLFRLLSATLALWLAGTNAAQAASIIRDAEIEHTLRSYIDPILVSAEIEPDSVRLFVLGDPSINAFVAGGLNIFLHTGIILHAETPDMLIGVMAHETGHIAGAHLSKLSQKSDEVSIGAVLATVVGAAAAIGGGGKAGGAIMLGGQSYAQRDMMAFFRGNEQAADNAGISYLHDNGYSAKGMLDMFEELQRSNRTAGAYQDPFLQTHPLTKERIAHLRDTVAREETNLTLPEDYAMRHARMLAKLRAFLEPSAKTLGRFPNSDQSLPARFARAIAYHRSSRRGEAKKELDSLLKDLPNDPFFWDLKGQIAFEDGQVKEAITAYETASRILPESALILSDLGKSYVTLNDPVFLPKAIDTLERSAALDSTHGSTWRQLAIAYGKQGDLGMSYLSLAQEASLANKPEEVIQHTARALDQLPANSPGALKAEDLQREARRQMKEGRDKKRIF